MIPVGDSLKAFETWRRVRLGRCQTASAYHTALLEGGFKIGPFSEDLLDKTPISLDQIDVELISLSVDELGFPNGTTYGESCKKGIGLGLNLSPGELGAALRLDYHNQPRGEFLRLAMTPILHTNGKPGIFWEVDHGDGVQWLGGTDGSPDVLLKPEDRLVFIRRP